MNPEAQSPAEPAAPSGLAAANYPPTDGLGRFFHRADWLSFGVTAALALAVYSMTLAPEVTLGFSGIFSAGAMYLGVPHPPGYPLWTVYAWLFTKLLPWSNVAWRLAMASAVPGALTCGLIALMASRGALAVLEAAPGLRRLSPKPEHALRVICGCVAGMAFGLDGAFWPKAVIVEVWTLSMLLLAAVLCLLMRWLYAPDRRAWLYAAALMYGLTLTNSQALAVAWPGLVLIVVLGAPALGRDLFCAAALLLGAVVLAHGLNLLPDQFFGTWQHSPIWRMHLVTEAGLLVLCGVLGLKTRAVFTEWKGVLETGTMLAMGLSLYLCLPFFSMANPPVNWGYPRTFEGFIHDLSRGQYESVRPTDSLSQYGRQLGMYAQGVFADLGVIYLLPAVIPFWLIRGMPAWKRRWMLGLLAVYLCLSLFMVALLNPAPDRASRDLTERFFSASHLVLAIWAGYGLAVLGALLIKPKERAPDSCGDASA